jgi:exodeoxyribonuclease-3
LRIITWNVNGLRALLEKGGWNWLQAQDADVICLQEIKARPDQLKEDQNRYFDEYEAFWNPAQRPGYSGVLTLTKPQPTDLEYGIAAEDFDVEGRVVRARYPGFHLYNIYFPNGQRGQERVDYKLAFYARLLELCDQMHARGEHVVICGDFNTAHREIDLKNPKENAKTSGFLPEERALLDTYLKHGLVDAYRQLYPERVQYTWWTYRMNARQRGIGWRLDFYMVSDGLVGRVKDVIVHDDVMGSDHCPVSLIIED